MLKFIFIYFLIPFLTFGQENVKAIENLIAEKDYEGAKKRLELFMSKGEQNFYAVELLGDVYGHLKKWELAQNQYAKLLEYDKRNADYHYKYGGATAMRAQEMNKIAVLPLISEIKESFRNAISYNPKHIDARWALLHLYLKLPFVFGGGNQKALHQANEIMKLSKVDGYLALGVVYSHKDEFKLSEQNFMSALHIGHSKVCYLSLCELYKKNEYFSKSYDILVEGYEKNKTHDFLFLLAKLSYDHKFNLADGLNHLNNFILDYNFKSSNYTLQEAYNLRQGLCELKKNL